MIELGAHVAAVAGEKNGALEISLRSSLEFYKETNIHLGRDIAKPAGEYLRGMGGGHATAAGVNGEGDIEIGLKRCLWLLKEKLANHN
jgi:nanoRNase/pAp phosphatase (c-di-AMP/oligoRNAs hydrolase)